MSETKYFPAAWEAIKQFRAGEINITQVSFVISPLFDRAMMDSRTETYPEMVEIQMEIAGIWADQLHEEDEWYEQHKGEHE